MAKEHVFISYKSEDFDHALWVKDQLEAQGLACWMAPMSISGGASYASEIPAAIQNCPVFVLILSEIVQTSKWVSRELDQAINANKRILPFMIENCKLTDEFGFYLSNVQRYYAYQDKQGAMDKMVTDIRAHVGLPAPVAEPVTEVTPTQQPVPVPAPPAAPKVKTTPASVKAAKPRKKKWPIVLAVALLVPVLLVTLGIVGIVGLVKNNRIEIAGTTYDKSEYSITIENQKLSATDLAQLAKFKDLDRVTLKQCTLLTDDLSVLGTLDLYTLEMELCSLTDAQLSSVDFSALNHLDRLNLNQNAVLTDLSVLAPVADTVTELSVDGIALENTDWLADFTQLKFLSVNRTGLESLACLSNMAYLEKVYADGNALTDLNGLANATLLHTVSAAGNRLTDVSALTYSAAKLRYLDLDINELSDLSALADCTQLLELSVNDNRLTSLAFTSQMDQLKWLYASSNRLTSLEGITQSKELSALNVSHNALTSVEGLVFTSEWSVTADFSNNQIATASLPTDCRYGLLALHGNPLQNADFLNGTAGSKVSFDYFDNLDVATLKTAGFNNIYVGGAVPVNRKVELEQANYAVELVDEKQLEELIA